MVEFCRPILNPNNREGLKAFEEFAESWFASGNKCYIVLRKESSKVLLKEAQWADQRQLPPFLKTILNITLIVPAILFAIKCLYRLLNQFEIQPAVQKPIVSFPPLPTANRIQVLQERLQILRKEFGKKEPVVDAKKSILDYAGRAKRELKSKDPKNLARFFTDFSKDLPQIVSYLRQTTKGLVKQQGSIDSAKCAEIKAIQKALKEIFVHMLAFDPKPDELLATYETHVQQFWGNRHGDVDTRQPVFYFGFLSNIQIHLTEESNDSIMSCINEMQLLRRHYCMRVQKDKIDKIILNKFGHTPDERTRTLLEGTWYHGTRVLEGTKESDFRYIPSGWLQKLHLVPQGGELWIGAAGGINSNNLSGTALDNVETAIQYAKNESYGFSQDRFTRMLDRFLTYKFDKLLDIIKHVDHFAGILHAMRGLARLGHQSFTNNYKNQLVEHVKLLKAQQKAIGDQAPRELYAHHDESYLFPFNLSESLLTEMEQFLTSALPQEFSEEERRALESSFPVVVGSKSLLAIPTKFDDQDREHTIFGDARLGDDIQILATSADNQDKARHFLEKYGFREKISLYTFDELVGAESYNKAVSPYMADLFSKKKLRALTM